MAKNPTPLQQALAITRGQYAPIDYALNRANQRNNAEQAALAATGAALLKQLQAGAAPAGRSYDAAIAQQQGLAQGGASLLASLSPNAQVQSELAAINAPSAQREQIAAALQAQYPGQGAVLNIQEGTIPGASLAAQKASTQQFLAGLPTLAALAQQQSARGLAARLADTRDKLLEQRLAVSGRIPELALGIAQADRTAALDERRLQNSINESIATRAYNARQAQLNREFQAQQNALSRQASARSGASIIGSSGSGYYRVNADGSLTRLTKPTGGGKASGTIYSTGAGLVQVNPDGTYRVLPGTGGSSGSKSSRSKAFERTRSDVYKAVGLLPSVQGVPIDTLENQGITHRQRKQAFNNLYGIYAAPLLRAGVDAKSVKAMIDTALNKAGYAVPSKRSKKTGVKYDSRGNPVG